MLVSPESTVDRIAARSRLRRFAAGERVRLFWADDGYTGTLLDWVHRTLALAAWITRHRRRSGRGGSLASLDQRHGNTVSTATITSR
ncbi:hypothetical protein V1227_04985 [Lentzea sp. DG1S-22]|uniref:hypothetical protein n=1 Tax=Lentzea sp. DG1S-22 TaxID=3108822 RepID=UPI002E7A7059|nr:hypothetical protein [Lentzea sp. DG1S-22]WVH82113.1 hypothetical protein V1227_04985 [Lentzea sp. DG1S-22]